VQCSKILCYLEESPLCDMIEKSIIMFIVIKLGRNKIEIKEERIHLVYGCTGNQL
jgi:hypothetical protein